MHLKPDRPAATGDAVRTPELCTETEIHTLVHSFYAAVRGDPLLGPVFEAHVDDWPRHLSRMVDFWSSVLLGTARNRGTPMPVHCALPNLAPELFRRWLRLFRDTTATLGNGALQAQADELSHRIAQSLWFGYQLHHAPGRLPDPLGSS
jgi:hemoglobin